MAQIGDEVWFAPDVPMQELNFSNEEMLIDVYESRIHGFFISPINSLLGKPNNLFVVTILCAALIESISRVQKSHEIKNQFISSWLTDNIPDFSKRINDTDKNVADYFEERYRNGLVHNGYINSFGRLSNEITEVIKINNQIVVINPFILVEKVEVEFNKYLKELRTGQRRVFRKLCQSSNLPLTPNTLTHD